MSTNNIVIDEYMKKIEQHKNDINSLKKKEKLNDKWIVISIICFLIFCALASKTGIISQIGMIGLIACMANNLFLGIEISANTNDITLHKQKINEIKEKTKGLEKIKESDNHITQFVSIRPPTIIEEPKIKRGHTKIKSLDTIYSNKNIH
jgi:hypothetical protein